MSQSNGTGVVSMPASVFRWKAILLAAVMGIVTIPFVLVLGRNMSEAATIGCIAAIAGTIVWFIYHLVSRRNDGLALIGLASMNCSLAARHELSLLALACVTLAVLAPIAWIAGLWFRQPRT